MCGRSLFDGALGHHAGNHVAAVPEQDFEEQTLNKQDYCILLLEA
jgi:hypothetical protein